MHASRFHRLGHRNRVSDGSSGDLRRQLADLHIGRPVRGYRHGRRGRERILPKDGQARPQVAHRFDEPWPARLCRGQSGSGPCLPSRSTSDASSSIEIWNTRTWKGSLSSRPPPPISSPPILSAPTAPGLLWATIGSGAVWSIETRQRSWPCRSAPARSTRSRSALTAAESPRPPRMGSCGSGVPPGRYSTISPAGQHRERSSVGSRMVVASLDGGRVQISDWRTSGQELGHFMIPSSRTDDIVSLSPGGEYVADVAATPCPSGLTCRWFRSGLQR